MSLENYYKKPIKYFFDMDVEMQKLMFHIFNGDKEHKSFNLGEPYDALSFINVYMKSDVRAKMDEGDYTTHGYGGSGVYRRIDKSECLPRTKEYDIEKLRWMAEVYCIIQWKYNIYSKDIASVLPASVLYEICNLKISPRDFAIDIYNDQIADKNFEQVQNCKPFDAEIDKDEEWEEDYDTL